MLMIIDKAALVGKGLDGLFRRREAEARLVKSVLG